jgi:hypothetical protein
MMKRRTDIAIGVVLMLVLALVFSCSGKKEAPGEFFKTGDAPDSTLMTMSEEAAPALAPPPPSPAGDTTGTTPVPAPTVKKRKIIKTAEITIEVKDFADSMVRIKEIVREVAPNEDDGSIFGTTESKSESGKTSGTVVIRINPDRFDLLIDKLVTVGDVQYQRISGEDVTKEYYDLQARLSSKKEMEKRLIQLLATRTNSVADLLEVERELGRVREEIESIQGTIRYYDDLVGMSTVNLTITEPESVVAGAGGFWGPIKQAVMDSFEVFGKSIAALIIFVMGVLPWAVVAFIVFLIVRRIVRKRRAGAEQAVSAKTKGK